MAESKVGMPSKPRIEPPMRSQEVHRRVEGLSSQESDQQEEQDMTESGEEMSSDSTNEPSMGSLGSPPLEEPSMGTNPPIELWVGFVNDVPLVGTSADMVDGFIALLQGDRRTAEAKGYKDFLDSAGSDELAESILQKHGSQAVIGCSAEASKHIFDRILMARPKTSKPTSKQIKAAKAVKEGEQSYKDLKKSSEVLMGKLFPGGFPGKKPQEESQNQTSKQGEHVFNRGLLKLYGTIIEKFIEDYVPGSTKEKLVKPIPYSRVSDAFQDNEHINLTAKQRKNIENWVVQIPNDVVYISVNSVLFGHMAETIRANAADYMHSFYQKKTDTEVMRRLDHSVQCMIKDQIYLDPMAVRQWFAENPDRIPQFHYTDKGVKVMLRHLVPQDPSLLLCDFMNDLTQAVTETRTKIKDRRIFRDKCTSSKKKS